MGGRSNSRTSSTNINETSDERIAATDQAIVARSNGGALNIDVESIDGDVITQIAESLVRANNQVLEFGETITSNGLAIADAALSSSTKIAENAQARLLEKDETEGLQGARSILLASVAAIGLVAFFGAKR